MDRITRSDYQIIKQTINLMDWMETFGKDPEVPDGQRKICTAKINVLLWVLSLPSGTTKDMLVSIL